MSEVQTSSSSTGHNVTNGTSLRVQRLTSASELDELLKEQRAILYFRAEWAAPCKQMGTVFDTLRQTHSSLSPDEEVVGLFLSIDANAFKNIAKKYYVSRIPSFLFVSNTRVVRRIDGADAAGLTKAVRWFSAATDNVLLTAECEYLMQRSEVMLFLKGPPSLPRCAFGCRIVDILRNAGVVFDTFDVSIDAKVRERIKEVAMWETYPLLCAQGRVIGGIDVVERLYDERRLLSELARKEGEPAVPIGSDDSLNDAKEGEKPVANLAGGQTLEERLRSLISQQKIMMFMKGTPEQPRCGFSRTMTQLLRDQGVQFGTFDILTDEEVRQGLKKFSNWPTYPQLYSNGRLVGGLDVVKELIETGELETELQL